MKQSENSYFKPKGDKMRYVCRYIGLEMKSGWKLCGDCEWLFMVSCPSYRSSRDVVTEEFANWFYENRGEWKGSRPEDDNAPCETQSSNQKVSEK